MKILAHQRNISKTAPSTDESECATRSVCTDRDRSSSGVSKAGRSFISCLSVRSDSSRFEPPTFSCDPPGKECGCLNGSQDDLHKLNEVSQTPGHLFTDRLPVEQREYALLELYQRKLKSFLKHQYKRHIEGPQSIRVCLREALSEGLHQDQALPKQSPPECPLDCTDLFRCPSERMVLTTGPPGVGKSVLVQRSIVDWCEDRALQHVQLLCPLPVAQLNLLQQQSWTLMELLQTFCPGLRESGLTNLSDYRLLFILDGLDECRLPLDFSTEHRSCDAGEAMPVDALLTNLMEGNLLPHAQLWIICRPAAARSIPPTLIHRATQVPGFSSRQKEAYFLQNIQDEEQAQTVLANVRSCAALHSMSHLPLFCSITASTHTHSIMTHRFLHFLSYHMRNMQHKYGLQRSRVSTVIQALSKLAHQQLQRGQLLFWEQELTACGVEVTEALLYSGLCSQVFTEDRFGGHWAFSFVHPSVQQFLAALYVFMSFSGDRDDLHPALRDHPLVPQFLMELSLDSSVSLLTHMNIQRGKSMNTAI